MQKNSHLVLELVLDLELQITHGNGKGSTILTKQKIITRMQKDQEW
jgi:hypothetical protein